MSRSRRPCLCIDRVNAELAPLGQCVPTLICVSREGELHPVVRIERVDGKAMKRSKSLLLNFCPWCGLKLGIGPIGSKLKTKKEAVCKR